MRATTTPGAGRLALTAVFVALTAVATLFLKVQGPTGYYHLGDGFYYAAALLLGPWPGALAGGLGGALADVLGGYALPWAPVTLVIKGAGGLLAGLIAGGRTSPVRRLAGLAAAALPTVIGYPLVTWPMFGWPAAVNEFYFDLGQTLLGIAVALALLPLLGRALVPSAARTRRDGP